MQIIQRPSPNFDERPDDTRIRWIVLHHTDMQSAEAALELLCNPEKVVSCHYLIGKDGAVYQLVPDAKRARHAGVSYWQGDFNLNRDSIGIELDNPGYQYGPEPFPKQQIQQLVLLLRQLCVQHQIPPENIVGHSDIATNRKKDPSHMFDWHWLYQQGFGIWPGEIMHHAPLLSQEWVRSRLAEIGYYCPKDDHQAFVYAVRAFQCRFFSRLDCLEITDDMIDTLAHLP